MNAEEVLERRKTRAFLVGLALLAAAIPLGLYGLFAILYRDHSGNGNTYVTFAGREFDADLVGALALLLALIAGLAARVFLRRPRRFAKPS